MADSTSVGKRLQSVETSPEFDGYSKVVIKAGTNDNGEDIVFVAGDDTGRTLEIENPWGTQANANDILARIKSFQYQPYVATAALLDPAAEIGDGVTVNGIYSGIYERRTTFSGLMTSDISAPYEEEIDHEYGYESSKDRKYSRQFAEAKSQIALTASQILAEVSAREAGEEELRGAISIQATQIEAKVSKSGGSGSSFGWTLDDSSWTITAGGNTVLKATSSGLEVSGKITATSGMIGGFDIGASAIYNNISVFGGSQSSGVYIGTDGIQLGQNFKVDRYGNLTAASGTFTGNVNAGNINYGGDAGYLDGYGITGGTVGSYQVTGGINTSLGYADFSNLAFNNGPSAMVNAFATNQLWVGAPHYGTNQASWCSATLLTGGSVSINYVTTQVISNVYVKRRGSYVSDVTVSRTNVVSWVSASFNPSSYGGTIHYLGHY